MDVADSRFKSVYNGLRFEDKDIFTRYKWADSKSLMKNIGLGARQPSV